jgi:hypothetical protein
MWGRLHDWWQTLSWKRGYAHGKKGRPHQCPWWADKLVYAAAYLQGKGLFRAHHS